MGSICVAPLLRRETRAVRALYAVAGRMPTLQIASCAFVRRVRLQRVRDSLLGGHGAARPPQFGKSLIVEHRPHHGVESLVRGTVDRVDQPAAD